MNHDPRFPPVPPPGYVPGRVPSPAPMPGPAAPGWLMVLAAPIYALLVYMVMLLPFQISGSGWFVLAIGGFIGAQVWRAVMGYRPARPMTSDEAAVRLGRSRRGYLAFTAVGLLFLVVGFATLIDDLQLSAASVLNLVMGFVANVLLLQLVAADLLVGALARGRAHQRAASAIDQEFGRQVEAFVAEAAGAVPPGRMPG